MSNPLFYCFFPTFSFITQPQVIKVIKIAKGRHVKAVYLLHSSSLPLSCAQCRHIADIQRQTHVVTHVIINQRILTNPAIKIKISCPCTEMSANNRTWGAGKMAGTVGEEGGGGLNTLKQQQIN